MDARQVGRRELAARLRPSIARDGPAGFPIGRLLDPGEIGIRVLIACFLGPFDPAEVGVGLSHLPNWGEIALRLKTFECALVAPVACLERRAL